MYYVVSKENVGPNAQPLNEKVYIQIEPERTNSSHEILLDGWLGTTNDFAMYAYGEYPSIEEAEAFISKQWSGFSSVDLDEHEDETVVKVFKDSREVWDAEDYFDIQWYNDQGETCKAGMASEAYIGGFKITATTDDTCLSKIEYLLKKLVDHDKYLVGVSKVLEDIRSVLKENAQ